MSESQNNNDNTRNPCIRVFAEEFNKAKRVVQSGEGEKSPKHQILPSGAKANRVFIVGTLTEVTDISKEDNPEPYWRGTVVDPTGNVQPQAGEFRPAASSFLSSVEPPKYVAVVGKARTDDEYINLMTENIFGVDAETRDKWVLETAEQTLNRLEDESEEAQYCREMYEEDFDIKQTVINALEEIDPKAEPSQ